ncbi:MAG: SpoIIE family protein phosphatase, partial [Bacteroidales bacterium]
FIFYRPIEALNWSLAMICPANAIFKEVNQLAIWMSVVLFLSLIILFVFCYKIIRRITLPLRILTKSAEIIAEGNFYSQLPKISTGDELSQLCNAFESMQNSLSKYITQLKITTSAKERIESELRIGSKIQFEMLPHAVPKFTTSKEIDLFAALQPAKEVGGDFYDYMLKGDKLIFIIGDVAGKGVPAALMMAMITSLFHSVATIHEKPEKIVQEINRTIIEKNNSDMFATLVVGIISLNTMEVSLCNAGHNPLVLITEGKRPIFITVTPNLPVGVIENMKYKPDKLVMTNGDTLFLYTDGITEAENKDKELFGEKRFIDMLSATPPDSVQLLIINALSAIRNYTKQTEQSDDITAMAIRIGGTPPNTLILRNKIEEIEKLIPFTEMLSQKAGISPTEGLSLNLVLEEVVSNIILYGYKIKKEDQIKITCTIYNETIIFTISDSAKMFDITKSSPKVDITQTAKERPIGGLGIYLINNIMDSVEYFNICGYNTLILKKNISKQQ